MRDRDEARVEPSGEIGDVRLSDDALLSVRGVESGYGDLQVLYGVDLDVRRDEIVTVFGPNGAGKSTLLKTIARVLPLWAGEIRLGGRSLAALDTPELVDAGLAYVPQTENVFPNLTVSENLDVGGTRVEDADERRADLYELFPLLEERTEQRAGTLSGGERQMLAMARALVPDPDVLLLDEPSAGLAPSLVDRVFEHVEGIRDSGTAVLVVEQNVRAALAVADRGYVLDMGRTRFEGDAGALLSSDRVRGLYLGRDAPDE